jgi:predicted ABC-type ATPase
MKVLERRPILLVLAGPNGAGKSTFYYAHLRPRGLRFVNADELAQQLGLEAYKAADVADQIRRELLAQGESFAFETVFSDPVGAKLEFMKEAEKAGYAVVLFFIGIDKPAASEERVAMRAAQGGHDVPHDKLMSRFARVMKNLKRAMAELSNVRVYDNSDLLAPYRLVALVEDGALTLYSPTPAWLKPLLPPK